MFQTNIALGVQSADTDRNEVPLPFFVISSDFSQSVVPSVHVATICAAGT